ncbi:MAG: glycosyltransferase family 2 protein [Clostridiaceae bacterium]|nr:glycosyltransferase family 2 protein [Clostridiaceae bacterium]
MLEEIAKERILLKEIRKRCGRTPQPGVSIITPTAKPQYVDNIITNYARLNYPYKELIIILNNNQLNMSYYKIRFADIKDVRIFQFDESYSLGKCLNFGIEEASYNYISKMDDDDYYGANYLTDLMNVFKYTDAEITGKSSSFVYFEDSNTLSIRDHKNQYKYMNTFHEYISIKGSTILLKKKILEKVKFKNLNCGEDTEFLIDCFNAGIKVYAADKYNYVYMRHKNLLEHTWQVSSKELMSVCQKFLVAKNFIPFIEA